MAQHPGDTPAAERAPRMHWTEEQRRVNDNLHLIHVRVELYGCGLIILADI